MKVFPMGQTGMGEDGGDLTGIEQNSIPTTIIVFCEDDFQVHGVKLAG